MKIIFTLFILIFQKGNLKIDQILKIAKAHGIQSSYIDGNNCDKIYNKSKTIISNIRSKNKPHLIQLNTYRHLEHCGPNNDDNLKYRNKNKKMVK